MTLLSGSCYEQRPTTLDLTHVDTKAAFHHTMKRELHFPDLYGVSWDAF
ncbi:barstar family protein [Hymenobacter sp. IS2118]